MIKLYLITAWLAFGLLAVAQTPLSVPAFFGAWAFQIWISLEGLKLQWT